MKASLKLVGAAAALVWSGAAFAQTTPAAEPVAGLLGQRYAEAAFGFVDVNHSSVDAYGAGLAFNAPVNSYVDVGLHYGYSWVESYSSIDAHNLGVSATGYLTQENIKPFGTFSLGYNWDDGDDYAVWGVEAGVEIGVVKQFGIVFSAGYDDDFRNHGEGTFDGTVKALFPVNEKLTASVEASLIEGGHSAFTAGLALKF